MGAEQIIQSLHSLWRWGAIVEKIIDECLILLALLTTLSLDEQQKDAEINVNA